MPEGRPVADRAVAHDADGWPPVAGAVGRTPRCMAQDGTVTWIAPVINLPAGRCSRWVPTSTPVRQASRCCWPATWREVQAAGRARPVTGARELLAGGRRKHAGHVDRNSGSAPVVPVTTRAAAEPPGLYVGLGLADLVLDHGWPSIGCSIGDEGPRRAGWPAELLPDSLAATEESRPARSARPAAVVALLMLAEHTGDQRWVEQAAVDRRGLVSGAHRSAGAACWPPARAPHGMGGFAHGSTGIGWALARLASATGEQSFASTAEAALAFDDALYQPNTGRWRDLRELPESAPAWCHGAVGIGLAAADLIRLGFGDPARHAEVVHRAATVSWGEGMGLNHSICHGDLGCWELLEAAFDLGVAPAGLDRDAMTGYLLASIATHGPVTGLTRQVFSPGLLPGLSGIAYQLLRMVPGTRLGSVLVPGTAVSSG